MHLVLTRETAEPRDVAELSTVLGRWSASVTAAALMHPGCKLGNGAIRVRVPFAELHDVSCALSDMGCPDLAELVANANERRSVILLAAEEEAADREAVPA